MRRSFVGGRGRGGRYSVLQDLGHRMPLKQVVNRRVLCDRGMAAVSNGWVGEQALCRASHMLGNHPYHATVL